MNPLATPVASPVDRGPAVFVGADEGDSYWQPPPANGYVTVKLSPWNCPSNHFACGIQVIAPGGSLREHAHSRNEEILFVYGGRGVAVVDGVEHPVEAGSVVYAGRWVRHALRNEGADEMRVFWVILPPGLETVLKGLGRPRVPGEPPPADLQRPTDAAQLLAQGNFAEPEQLERHLRQRPPDKGAAVVRGPGDGRSFWQPEPSFAYATVLLSPADPPVVSNLFSYGVQVFAPGASLRPHAHGRNDEILFIYEGEGSITVQGRTFPIRPGATAFVSRFVEHTLVNTGPGELKLVWMIFPPGLETVFEKIGQPRQPGAPRPDDVQRPADVQEILERAAFATAAELAERAAAGGDAA